LAVARERFGDADPIVGVEVVGAVHEQDRRAPARAEGAVEDRDIAGIHPSVALHGWRLLVRTCVALARRSIPAAAVLNLSCPGLARRKTRVNALTTRASIEKELHRRGWIGGSSPAMTVDGYYITARAAETNPRVVGR